MKGTKKTLKVETYFTRLPENWDGKSWDHLSQGIKLPAGTEVTVLDRTNAGFRGIEFRVEATDGWKATVSESLLA